MQAFLCVNPGLDDLVMVVNSAIAEDKCQYRLIECKVLPPCCLPLSVRAAGASIALRILDTAGVWALKGAVSKGLRLTVQQLILIGAELKLPKLTPAKGKGSPKIVEYATQLVKHLFGDDHPASEVARMVAGIMGTSVKKLSEEAKRVLEMVKTLDPDNQQCFHDVSKLAKEKLEETVVKRGVKAFVTKSKASRAKRLKTRRRNFQKVKAAAARATQVAAAKAKAKGAGKGNGKAGTDATRPDDTEEEKPSASSTGAAASARGPDLRPRREKVTPRQFRDLLPGGEAHQLDFQPFRGDLLTRSTTA